MKPSKHVLTQGAANILGVNADTVRRYTDRGLLPLVRDEYGRRIFKSKELRRFARQRAVEKLTQ